MERTQRTPYKTPTIRDHGDIRDITLGNRTGAALDRDFNSDTLFSDLTFS